MAYLKLAGAFLLIFCVLTIAFWALSIAVRLYFDKKDFDRRLEARLREIDEEARRGQT